MRRAVAGPTTVELKPDTLEEYVLALVALGEPISPSDEQNFTRPECRALLAWLRTGAVGDPPAELAGPWATVQALRAEYADQPRDRLRAELDIKLLELRKRRLVQEKRELDSIVRDEDGGSPRALLEQLAGLAARRAEAERAQAAHGRVEVRPTLLGGQGGTRE
jgi:hypothetical protein